jgi:hypothetical protein
MSSPVSAVTVDLPRWPLADRLSLVLVLAAAVMVEAVLASYPGAPVGLGVVASVPLAVGLLHQRRRRPRRLEFAPADARLCFGDGTRAPFQPGPGCRLLGSSVVLHWRTPGRSGALWLTPADLPREILRLLAVRLVAGGRPTEQ